MRKIAFWHINEEISITKERKLIFVSLFPFHLYTARPGFEKPESCSPTTKSHLDPVPTTEKGLLPSDFVLEDPDSHFIYVCKKRDETELNNMPTYPLTNDVI